MPRCTILLRYTTPHRTVLYYTVLSYTTLHYTGLCYTTLHCAILHCATLNYYTVLHYTLLHCAILRCATLHCAAPRRTFPRCRATPRRMVARHPVLLCCAVLTAPPTAVEQSFLGGEPRGRVAGVQAQRSRGVCGPPRGLRQWAPGRLKPSAWPPRAASSGARLPGVPRGAPTFFMGFDVELLDKRWPEHDYNPHPPAPDFLSFFSLLLRVKFLGPIMQRKPRSGATTESRYEKAAPLPQPVVALRLLGTEDSEKYVRKTLISTPMTRADARFCRNPPRSSNLHWGSGGEQGSLPGVGSPRVESCVARRD